MKAWTYRRSEIRLRTLLALAFLNFLEEGDQLHANILTITIQITETTPPPNVSDL
jgi:hypothetical protein